MADALKPDKHGRDHCPGGEDPIPCLGGFSFRALHYDDAVGDDITVTASLIDITYNYWVNSAPLIFEPLTSAGGVPELGTHNVQRVKFLRDGLYTVCWGVHFDTSFAGGVAQYIHDNDPVFGRPEVTHHESDTVGAVSVQDGYFVMTTVKRYPWLDPFDSGATTPEISTDASQGSGSNKTVDEAFLEIHFSP